jgi:hypothetical protein
VRLLLLEKEGEKRVLHFATLKGILHSFGNRKEETLIPASVLRKKTSKKAHF